MTMTIALSRREVKTLVYALDLILSAAMELGDEVVIGDGELLYRSEILSLKGRLAGETIN